MLNLKGGMVLRGESGQLSNMRDPALQLQPSVVRIYIARLGLPI